MMPNARIVLLKEYKENGFVFFTNYDSKKAKEIEENENVCLLFFWKELERQVKIQGTIKKVSVEESEQYFQSRPYLSQIGAWASLQSQYLADRKILEENFELYKNKFAEKVALPKHWGGYIVEPTYMEFWHRVVYSLNDNVWTLKKLYP